MMSAWRGRHARQVGREVEEETVSLRVIGPAHWDCAGPWVPDWQILMLEFRPLQARIEANLARTETGLPRSTSRALPDLTAAMFCHRFIERSSPQHPDVPGRAGDKGTAELRDRERRCGMTSEPQQFPSDNYSEFARGVGGHGQQTKPALAYGDDVWTAKASDAFRTLFETDCEVFFAFNGTVTSLWRRSASPTTA
jgi:hypothetical protein